MKVYHEIKDMLERELEQIADKRELTSNNLEVMDKVVDIIKDIETIFAMRDAGDDGYSGYYPYYMYDDGMSGARGRGRYAKRDSMGRYSSEGMRGYSRDDSREHMIEELERMEREATDENQKAMIRNWKNQIKNA